MLNRTVALVFVLLATLDNVFGQSDALTDCAALEFSTVPKTCCVRPYGKAFVMANLHADTKLCKASSRLMAWANEYKINTLQRKSLTNLINTADQATRSTLCAYGAFMECVFEKNSWVDASGTVNTGALFNHLHSIAADDYWKRIATDMIHPMSQEHSSTYYNFTDIVVDNFESIQCTGRTVNLKPLVMAQMIQSELVWMCPEQAPYTTDNKCSEKMLNYQYCDGKIYSNNANGVFFFPQV